MQSDAAAGAITGYRFPDYLESYFQLKYPGSNIHVFNISRAGGNMQDVLTNRLPSAGLPLWAFQFNNYQHIGISQPTDNGALSSNAMYLAQSNIFLAPRLLSDGSSNLVTYPGWCSTNTIQWIGLGDPPGAAADGGALGGGMGRNNASTNAGWTLGIRGVDSFNMLSNAWVSDYVTNGGKNIQFIYVPAQHFLSSAALSWCFSFLRGITTDTNISTATVDWNSLTPVATDHCVISSISKNGNVLTFNRLDDRLPMAWDILDGTTTNNAMPAFILNPNDADFFKFTLQIANLPAGTYSVLIDGTPVATLPSTALAAGWNMFTNTVGPYWAQRTEVLGRIRDKEHINRSSLVPRAIDGTGMFSYFANISTKWGSSNFYRGDALISGLSPFVTNIFSLDALTAQAARPTNHTFTIMPFAPTAIVRASALTNALNVPVILDGSSSIKATNYYWEQISGLPQLDMLGQDRAKPMIISVTNAGTYTFRLTVSDGQSSNSSQVTLTFIQPTGRTIFVDGTLTANCLNNNYSIANRNGSGSDGNAYSNIQWAANASLPGDVIYIRGGLYTNAPTNPNQNMVTVSRSGTATAPIRYEAYNNEPVVLCGWGFSDADTNADGLADGANFPGWRQQLFLIPTNIDYIQVKGLTLTNSQMTGMNIEGNFCYIQECVAGDNWRNGFNILRLQASTITVKGDVMRWCEAYRSRHLYGMELLLENTTTYGFMSDCAIVDCISHHNGYQPDGREVLPINGDPAGGGNCDGIHAEKYFQDNANFNPTYGVRNWGTNFYFVRDIVWNNCDDGIDLSCGSSLIEDCRALFNGPTGNMGYKLFRYVQNMVYRGNIAYGNVARGFELRFDSNSCLQAYNNSSFGNAQQGFWIAGTDASSVLFGTNNVAAFNGGPAWPQPGQTYNWASDGANVLPAFAGNPMIVNTNLALSSAFGPGWTVRQKHDFMETQIKRALSPAAGSPLLSSGLFIPGYFCPRPDNDPNSPMPLGAPGRHWKLPTPNMGAFDLVTAGGAKPAAPTNLRSVTNGF